MLGRFKQSLQAKYQAWDKPAWVREYQREIVVLGGVLLAGLVALMLSLSAPDGLHVEDSSAGFSAQEVQGWMNQEILANSNPKEAKGKNPDEICPETASGSDTCQAARTSLQRTALRKLLPQMWALAQVEKEQIEISGPALEVAQKEMLKELQAQTGEKNPQAALDRVGLSMADLRHRAEAIAAFQKLLPPNPPPPSRKALRLAYRDLAPRLAKPPRANVFVWQTSSKSKAQSMLTLLKSGSKPSGKPEFDFRGFDYNQARQMPQPWRGFIMRPVGVWMASCSGDQWCVGLAKPPTPGTPAPPLKKIAGQLSNRMMYELKNLQIQALREQLASRWQGKTQCSGLSVCS